MLTQDRYTLTQAESRFFMSEDKGVAKTLEEYRASNFKLRAPEPRNCTFCGHPYAFPCDGKDKACLNKKWTEEYRARQAENASVE